MEHLTTTWRASLWARWLGWTLVIGLVFAASWVVASVVSLALTSLAAGVFVVPATFVAAFLIGMRFRSWWWLAGPAGVVMVLFVAAGLTTGELATLLRDAQLFGVSTGMSLFLVALVCLVGGGLLYAIPALLGVWWGNRREAGDVGPTRSSPDGDAST